MNLIYIFLWCITKIFLVCLWKMQVIGRENFPLGKVIVAPNHTSLSDPPIIGASIFKEMYFMAKEELFNNKLFSFLLKQLNGFPVKRKSVDSSAIKTAIEILKKNKVLVIFPEGGRRKFFHPQNLQLGFIKIAKFTQTNILPATIINSNNILKFRQIKVIFSPPISYKLSEDEILSSYINVMKKMLTTYS